MPRVERFDAQQFAIAYGIDYTLASAGRNGWININCPFCSEGDTKQKLGLNPKGYANCWRCGFHPIDAVVIKLLGVTRPRVAGILDEFAGTGEFTREEEAVHPEKISLPGSPLGPRHRAYLEGRGFDPDWLALEYGILGTGPKERWEDRFFGNRIIIPIYDRNGRLVSFQGRDISGESELRYKGCPIELSPVHYKRTLYGAQKIRQDLVVVVEGIFDKWRLGDGSVATYGTDITKHQLALLSAWPRIIFAYDSEPAAQAKAAKHGRELGAMGRDVEVVDLELGDRDLGDLSAQEIGEVRVALGLD